HTKQKQKQQPHTQTKTTKTKQSKTNCGHTTRTAIVRGGKKKKTAPVRQKLQSYDETLCPAATAANAASLPLPLVIAVTCQTRCVSACQFGVAALTQVERRSVRHEGVVCTRINLYNNHDRSRQKFMIS
ncbi:MAG: hypothetical protein LGB52_06975, partial [Sulfurovum sp.]|nr:hypothetical protein [Sulfurovum sp.]